MRKYLNLFPFVTTGVLLVLAGGFHNAAFAYASVLNLTLIVVKDAVEAYIQSRAVKPVSEEFRKTIQELNQRVTKMEYEKQMRGF